MFGFTKINTNEVGPCTILFFGVIDDQNSYTISDFTFFPAFETEVGGYGGKIEIGSIIFDVVNNTKYILCEDITYEGTVVMPWIETGVDTPHIAIPQPGVFEHQFDEDFDPSDYISSYSDESGNTVK